jgi:hypothetical protein
MLFSYSLFGNNKTYLLHLLVQIISIRKNFDKLKVVIHVESNYPYLDELRKQISSMNPKSQKWIYLKFHSPEKNPLIPYLWRYDLEHLVDYVDHDIIIVGEADSIFTNRYKEMILQYTNTEFEFCTVRDYITSIWPISAGAFFARGRSFAKIHRLIFDEGLGKNPKRINQKEYYLDQIILKEYVYPNIKNELLIITDCVTYYGERNILAPAKGRTEVKEAGSTIKRYEFMFSYSYQIAKKSSGVLVDNWYSSEIEKLLGKSIEQRKNIDQIRSYENPKLYNEGKVKWIYKKVVIPKENRVLALIVNLLYYLYPKMRSKIVIF